MGETRTDGCSHDWAAVRSADGHRFVLKVIPVADSTQAQALAVAQMAVHDRIESDHLVRRRGAIALADGTLAVVVEEVSGGSLAHLLGARGKLTAGETVTIVAPLLRVLADLHAVGVVHGSLLPGNILFSADGRPMVDDLGLARLLDRGAVPLSDTGSLEFRAPELVGGAAPSAASDVYATAALGWFCLTGASPAPAAERRSLTTEQPEIPRRLVEVLTACLDPDPAARPTAAEAALEVFDAAPAESVALASVVDPAAEITRRIRAAAVVSAPAPRGVRMRFSQRMNARTVVTAAVVLAAVAVAVGVGSTWFARPATSRTTATSSGTGSPLPAAAGSLLPLASQPSLPLAAIPTRAPTTVIPTRVLKTAIPTRQPTTAIPRSRPTTAVPPMRSQRSTQAVAASTSPRVAAGALLQGLVDARALAYVARSADLLDLVYAPGAAKAAVDRVNIASALRDGGTYLGLSFVVKDAGFVDGTADTARVRATILTPAYATGQPDGRRIPHAQETLGPCIFSLSLTPDGWRIVALTVRETP